MQIKNSQRSNFRIHSMKVVHPAIYTLFSTACTTHDIILGLRHILLNQIQSNIMIMTHGYEQV